MEQIELDQNVYDYVILLFCAWSEECFKHGETYAQLTDIAMRLKLPIDSEEFRIITNPKAPTDCGVNLVAMTLAKRAVELHFELG